jgi:hypothetical protein
MDNYIQVKCFEKYHPTYKDGRKMIWARLDVSVIYDYKIVSIPVEAKWLFITLLCAACETGNKIPNNVDWLAHISGVAKSSISKYVNMLQEIGLVVTNCDKMSQNVPTDRQTDEQTDRAGRFAPPSLSDLSAFIKEKGYSVDPEKFAAYYESKGWMIGKNKMKDWKAAVRTWELRNKQEKIPVEDYFKGKEML